MMYLIDISWNDNRKYALICISDDQNQTGMRKILDLERKILMYYFGIGCFLLKKIIAGLQKDWLSTSRRKKNCANFSNAALSYHHEIVNVSKLQFIFACLLKQRC